MEIISTQGIHTGQVLESTSKGGWQKSFELGMLLVRYAITYPGANGSQWAGEGALLSVVSYKENDKRTSAVNVPGRRPNQLAALIAIISCQRWCRRILRCNIMCISSLKLWRAMVRVHSASQLGLDAAAGPVAPPHRPAATTRAAAAPSLSPGVHGRRDQPEVFTIWMKSLVLNGSGCTVYDSAGSIVYRVDNYGDRRAADVCLMDLAGNVVLQILKKKLGFGRRWEGYRWVDQEQEQPRPWFKVARAWAWRGPSCCTCELSGGDSTAATAVRYRMDDGRIAPARGARIVDGATGLPVAEVKRKTTAEGVALGADVLTLAVEPGVDRSIIMGLVLVHGLINRAMVLTPSQHAINLRKG
ncbi:hypothetical protein U9M48_007362 [Paspalum notatum var. saurae]|uniref:Protein LURP-one-related 4 n=1 Tax=Paspalum notatum var. saurae TaxID=547442 RepID=A0AAQ3PRB3_PASNO